MANRDPERELVPVLTEAATALARLADDDMRFRAGVDAFRAEDADSFQRLLAQLDLAPHCAVICRWLCSKECVLQCLLLAGPPPREPLTIDLIPRFAELAVKITADEELVERLADAVEQRDAEGFRSLVKDLGAERFAHLLCHWACAIRCRLRCTVVCATSTVPHVSFVSELSVAGAALRGLLENRAVFDQAVKAGVALDCLALSGLFGGRGDCFLICEWICSWRCVLVCTTLCRVPVEKLDTSVEEMREFAQALDVVVKQPALLQRLADAVRQQNADAFASAVKEAQLERFCIQLCHWICYELCRLFCICVCPEPATIPLFTHVGTYRVLPVWNDFTADGTTTAGGLAFTSTIPLRGILPDGTAPDALEYRFRFEKYPLGGGPADVTSAMIAPTVIGQLEYWAFIGGSWTIQAANYYANNPGATITIPQPGPPLGPISVSQDVKPGGWIEVPRNNALFFGGSGRFVPTGDLVDLDTTKLTDESFDLTSAVPPLPLKAGDSVPSVQHSEKPHYKLSFEARKLVGGTSVSANDLAKIALSNTHFTYVRHLDWAGYTVAPPVGESILVLTLDIQELLTLGGCAPLETDVHALFTAYHPYLASCTVRIEGPGIPPPAPANPPISADGEARSPVGGQNFSIASLTPCAYIVWLTATLNLTVGFGPVYGTFEDHIAFCKH